MHGTLLPSVPKYILLSWSLYYSPRRGGDRIITGSIICFNRHITRFPDSSWIVIRILIACISFFCAWQTPNDKAVEISGIHQYIIVTVGNETSIIFWCICPFPYQLCNKVLPAKHFIATFFQILLLVIINTDKDNTVITQ